MNITLYCPGWWNASCCTHHWNLWWTHVMKIQFGWISEKKKKKDTIWWWKGNPSNDEKHGSPLIDFLIICCLHCISIVSWILDFVYLIGPYCFHIMTFHPGMVIEWFFCGQTSVFPSFGATFFIHHSVDPAMMDCIEILFLGVTIDSLHCILCDAWLFSIFVTGPKT